LPAAIDDELAKAVGLETLAELRQEVRQRMQRDYDGITRQRLKQGLLDKLAERYDFPVPPGMIEMEFNSIWAQYEADKERLKENAPGNAAPGAEAEPGAAPEDSAGAAQAAAEPVAAVEPAATAAPEGGAPAVAPGAAPGAASDATPDAAGSEDDEKAREEFRRVAERRVRLGLLLAEVGRNNNITVTQEELNQALAQEARRLPGYERQVIDYYRKNPDAVNHLRAPIFEEKVVDFIVELAKPDERKVTPQELMNSAEPDSEPGSENAPAA
jgi:trigger factor